MPSTCLGCGCACDDIELTIDGNRIREARHACPLGVAWFGNGEVPARARVNGRDAADDEAFDAAAALLADAGRPLVFLAPELTCETQREAVALADRLRAFLDSMTTATALGSILAAQERGRASATLGEVRNRADVLVFWGVEPAARYPRYATRYAPDPLGLHVPAGRRSRTVIAVDIGTAVGPADADHRFAVDAEGEVALLAMLRDEVSASSPAHPLARLLVGGRYVVVVADAEADEHVRDAGRTSALIALVQTLNGPTRAALSTLRAGGNRSGADAVLTMQTGYPLGVDFARGYPRYRPFDHAHHRLERGEVDAALVLGATASLSDDLGRRLAGVRCAVVGPRASDGPLAAAAVVIDTGVAGIHEAGTALRMDDVPLPVDAPIAGVRTTRTVVQEVSRRLLARVGSQRP